jgi:hypothetical protein
VATPGTEVSLDSDMLLVTLELLAILVAPLPTLCLRGPWPLRAAVSGVARVLAESASRNGETAP